jgi:BCD family chlorophyll transporter-like MFS transporter
MGLWGASQALAFALGGFLSTTLVDSARFVFGSPAIAFGIVFFVEAVLFFVAAHLAAHGGRADLESAINLTEGAINA